MPRKVLSSRCTFLLQVPGMAVFGCPLKLESCFDVCEWHLQTNIRRDVMWFSHSSAKLIFLLLN